VIVFHFAPSTAETSPTRRLVVHAGHFQRLHEAGRAELLELLVVDVEVLEPQRIWSPVIGLPLPYFSWACGSLRW